jgi:uncharacterized protein involved in exopolysaccharide biosynthesis
MKKLQEGEIIGMNFPISPRLFLLNWKKFVLVFVISATIGLLVTVISAPIWSAKCTILIPLPKKSDPTVVPGMLMGPSQVDILNGAITSKYVLDRAAKKAGMSTKLTEQALSIRMFPKGNRIELQLTHSDKNKALAALGAVLDATQQLNNNSTVLLAARQASALKASVSEKTSSLLALEAQYVEAQKNSKVYVDPNDLRSVAQYQDVLRVKKQELMRVEKQIADYKAKVAEVSSPQAAEIPSFSPANKWRDRLVELQYSLRIEEISKGPQAPSVVALRKQIEVTQNQLANETKAYLKSVNSEIDPKLSELEAQRSILVGMMPIFEAEAATSPTVALNLQRLSRELQIQRDVLSDLRKDYERAVVDAEVERIGFTILDRPYIEDEPVNKRMLRTPATFGLLGILLFAAVLLIGEAKRLSNLQGPSE